MVEWLNANIAYWHWIVFGLLLAGLEIFVPSFVILWFGVSAIVIGLLLLLMNISVTVQLLIWAILSVVFLALWHKLVSPRMHDKTMAGLSREAIVGKVGTVLDYSIENGRGCLRFPAPILGNDEWELLSEEKLVSGDRVIVADVSGNTLIVRLKK
jgi:inner membrane protein